jgi:hypothetical protein
MLRVVFEGGGERVLDAEALAELDPVQASGDSGKGGRDAFRLRDLVRRVAGQDAVLLSVADADGGRLDVTPEDWADAAREPLLRLNRRGALKFHWADADLRPLEGESVKNVTTLVVRQG